MRKNLLSLSRLRALVLTAVMCVLGSGNAWGQTWEKATSIQTGDVVILVAEDASMELTSISTTSTKYGIGTAYTSSPAGTYSFTVVSGNSEGTFAFKNGNNYLYWNSGNSLATNSKLSNNTSWTVSFDEDGNAALLNAADEARQIWWNVGSPRFACYTGKTAGDSYYNVQLYKRSISSSTCATPTFSPAAGAVPAGTVVEISTITEGATIYYTTDGNTPTTSSTQGNSVTINEATTIKAIAVKDKMESSDVATAIYTIESPSFNQDWEGTMHGWSFVSVEGDQVWSVASYSNNHYAKMNGYANNSNNANEDWCISPAFNLNDYNNPVLTFTTARSQHNGNDLEVYFSNNFDGTNVSDATWNKLTCTLPDQPASGYTDFTSSGNIDLSNYSGTNCYIGFKYTSTTSAAATWEVDDIVLASQTFTPVITITPTTIDLGSGNPTGTSISKTFTVSQNYLTAGITLSLEGDGELDITSIAKDAETITVTWTYTPAEAGNINATITATSTGAETQTLTISGAAVAPITGESYEKVTEAPQDWSGCYIITGTNSGDYYALTGVENNLGSTAAVTVVGDKIESNETTDAYRVIAAQTENGYSLYMDGVGYLGYNSDATSGSNYLHALQSYEAETCEWTIAYSSDGATFTNVRNTGRKLQFNYNSGNSRFACYTSNQVKPTLFKYTGTVVLPPSISARDVVEIDYDATQGVIAYTISNPTTGASLNATITTGSDWISNINVEDDKVTFSSKVNDGETDREGTITLSYTGADDKVVTVKQKHYVVDYATLPFRFNGTDMTNVPGLTNNGVGSYTTAGTPGQKFDTEGDWMILKINESPSKLAFDIKGQGTAGDWTGTFTVQTSANGTEYENLVEFTELDGSVTTKTYNLEPTVRFIRWIFTSKTSGFNVAVGNIRVNYVTFTIKDGFPATTFSSDVKLDFGNLVPVINETTATAYIIIDGNGNTDTAPTIVDAYTGLYIEGDAGSYDVPMTSEDAPSVTGNLLIATDGNTTYNSNATTTFYAYGKQNDKYAFFKVPTSGYTPSANKAVLAIPTAKAKDFIEVNGGDATSINAVETLQNENAAIYNLAGQRVVKAQKGIYIVNGKKVVIK